MASERKTELTEIEAKNSEVKSEAEDVLNEKKFHIRN